MGTEAETKVAERSQGRRQKRDFKPTKLDHAKRYKKSVRYVLLEGDMETLSGTTVVVVEDLKEKRQIERKTEGRPERMWAIPGGGMKKEDGTSLDAVAREAGEEVYRKRPSLRLRPVYWQRRRDTDHVQEWYVDTKQRGEFRTSPCHSPDGEPETGAPMRMTLESFFSSENIYFTHKMSLVFALKSMAKRDRGIAWALHDLCASRNVQEKVRGAAL